MVRTVNIKAIGATKLKNLELFSKQDPYMTIVLQPESNTIKATRVHQDGGTSASWGDSFSFTVNDYLHSFFVIAVMDKNDILVDKCIGRQNVMVRALLDGHTMNERFNYVVKLHEQDDVGVFAGDVQLEVLWYEGTVPPVTSATQPSVTVFNIPNSAISDVPPPPYEETKPVALNSGFSVPCQQSGYPQATSNGQTLSINQQLTFNIPTQIPKNYIFS